MQTPPSDAYTGFLFRRAQQAHVATWSRVVSTEISSVQFGVLNALNNHPGASQRDLCELLDLDRSTIADLVARLQRRGLIERVRDPEDRRRNILELTTTGRRELRRLLPRVGEVDAILDSGLTVRQRAQLRDLLNRVLRSPRVRAAMGDPSGDI